MPFPGDGQPAVGFASDLLVRCGATVMFSEVTEVRDAIHLLTPRVADQHVGKRLLEEMAWYDDYLNQGQTDRSANPSPGNKKGGLANVVEKALGSIAKSGSSAIVEVLSLVNAPANVGLFMPPPPPATLFAARSSWLPALRCKCSLPAGEPLTA
ncbi:D-galactarate dehydratase [Serratia fonticola]|uniref:D-galactarate dehydratase n=1 Tax=Serratia fonticola TaxID=47917 RepID=A0A4U9VKE2_SERFO|nr:D-galactarate dehydratase [Serratia fonticola]